MAWANDASGRGWTAIFGGISASATSATRVRSASASRSAMVGIEASTSRADRYRSGGVPGRLKVSRVYAAAMAYDASVPPFDVEQSLDNLKLERDAIVLYD